jgi:sulfur carrier protein ThiS
MEYDNKASNETTFVEFRRKVQNSELLALGVSQLLRELHFTGRLSVVIQNGTILKSGYEEGYFTRKDERRLT